MQLQSIHMQKLAKILTENNFLKELDLSWNELPPHEMLTLTTVLAKNRTLTFVNLSWNYLTCSDFIDPLKAEGRDEYKQARMKVPLAEQDEELQKLLKTYL